LSHWAAAQLWGDEAVAKAVEEPSPEPVTPELLQEVRRFAGNPGVLRSWALAQSWPRFCAIVRIVSGKMLSETLNNE
jgi:hypothetical protein